MARSDADGAIVVFDGVCALCNGWVDFLLARDRRGRYRFAAMQAPPGRALLVAHGLDPDDPASFLLLDEAGAHTGSDAIVRVLAGLGGLACGHAGAVCPAAAARCALSHAGRQSLPLVRPA